MFKKVSELGRHFIYASLVLASPTIAFAADAETAGGGSGAAGWISLAAGLAIGIAAFGGSLGQGKAAATALEGISRNPEAAGKMFVPMILGLVLIESLVIYAFVIAIILQGKV